MTMSAICARPPGFRTRAISRTAAGLSGTRLSTPFEITMSTVAIVHRQARRVALADVDVREPGRVGARHRSVAHRSRSCRRRSRGREVRCAGQQGANPSPRHIRCRARPQSRSIGAIACGFPTPAKDDSDGQREAVQARCGRIRASRPRTRVPGENETPHRVQSRPRPYIV